jgi:hypothetical protein
VEVQAHDDLFSLRHRLSWLSPGRVILVLPWKFDFLRQALDFDLLRREAQRRQMEIAIVSPDPERRELARGCGFPAFASVEVAERTEVWSVTVPDPVEPPKTPWWEEPVDIRPKPVRSMPTWVHWLQLGVRVLAFVAAVMVLAGTAYAVVPSADVTLIPAGQEFSTIVEVAIDPEIEAIDPVQRVIPARRVGLEVAGYLEVETTGVMDVPIGRAQGQVLFTNLLLQDYTVPAGTVVRTSSTSYPLRFRTTADVVVPAAGQATVPIEALDEGVGNVGAFQINVLEGVAASAVRVINPQPTTGAEPQETRVVVQADYDRAREQLIRQLLDQAYAEMGQLLDPTEFLLRQSLRIEAVPKEAFTHFIAERTETVGLDMRLLVSGKAVDVDNAEAVAYDALSDRLPEGYQLVDAWFDLGEVAEEEIGPGQFTFFVTAHGYAAAALDAGKAVALVRGRPIPEAQERLAEEFPLAQDARVRTWPESFNRLPLLPLRISVEVVPQERTSPEALVSRP